MEGQRDILTTLRAVGPQKHSLVTLVHPFPKVCYIILELFIDENNTSIIVPHSDSKEFILIRKY